MVRNEQVGLTERSVVINKLQTFFSMFSFIYSCLDRKKIFNEVIRKCDSETFESYEDYYNYALREVKTKIRNDVNTKYDTNCFAFFNAIASVFSSHFIMKDLDMLSKFKIVSEAFRVLKEPIDEDTWTMIIVRYPLLRNAIETLIETSAKEDDLEEFANRFPSLKGLFAQYSALSSKSLDFASEKVDRQIRILRSKDVQRLYNKMYEGSFEARDLLIESCLPYVRNVINNSKGACFSDDDLFQIGCLGSQTDSF